MYYRAKTWKLPQKFIIILSKSKITSEIYYRENKWEKYSLILKIFVPQIYCLVLTKTLKLLQQFLKIRQKNYEYKITMWYWSIKIQHYPKNTIIIDLKSQNSCIISLRNSELIQTFIMFSTKTKANFLKYALYYGVNWGEHRQADSLYFSQKIHSWLSFVRDIV